MLVLTRRAGGAAPLMAKMLLSLSLCGLAGCSQSSNSQSTPSTKAEQPKLALGKVLCLSTHWYPEATQQPDQIENPLLRELVRQAVLIVARDDFGLITRDETLGEPFPATSGDDKKSSAAPLEVAIDVRTTGKWNARLFGAGASAEQPVWKHEGTYNFDHPTIDSQLATQITNEIPKIAESLRSSGATGEAKKLNPENKPGDQIERQLGEMNFVSQFAAVQAAHQAIAENGASIEWLGVLVRGYANLSMLTNHFWSSQNEAFAARSLLYAERMLRLSNNQPLAQWHRAYARAILGMSMPALADVQALTAAKPTDARPAGDPPAWTQFIKPYANFEHDKIQNVATGSPMLLQLGTVLEWNLYHSYYHDRWIFESGRKTMRVCSEDYQVYTVWANWPALRLQREGAAAGIAAFDQYLPPRITQVAGLPQPVKEVATADKTAEDSPEDAAKRPIRISQALKKSAADDLTKECSWAILGDLIAEQQFVFAADIITAEQDATEHSEDQVVNQLMQLIGDHPCAAYISSFSDAARAKNDFAAHFAQVHIHDPNSNMAPLFFRGWAVPFGDGRNGEQLATHALYAADDTYFALCGALYNLKVKSREWLEYGKLQKLADILAAINPDAPQTVRLKLDYTKQSDLSKLNEYEKQLKDDPEGWSALAWAYEYNSDPLGAKRSYERSVKISPRFGSVKKLAYYQAWEGNKKLARQTMKDYGKLEDLGLDHFTISQELADWDILERNWKSAEPLALEAANAYSFGGLLSASRVYEGMRDTKKAEYYAAECTRSYPTYSGTTWYFFCRRLGAGDKDAARAIAEQSVKRQDADPSWYASQRAAAYYLLEGDPKNALRRLDMSKVPNEDPWAALWRLGLTTVAADELKDKDRRAQSIAEMRAVIAKIKETDARSFAALTQMCNAFEGAKFTKEDLDTIATSINYWDGSSKNYFQYYFGAALDEQGDKDNAALCWRRAAFLDPFNAEPATLAGDQLVKRFGPDRGGLPKEYADQEAKVAKEKSEAEASDSKEENEKGSGQAAEK